MAKVLSLQYFLTNCLLFSVETHTTSSQTYVIVDIDGTQYYVVCGENSPYLLVEYIPRQFEIGVPSAVVLTTNSGDMKDCFIIIHHKIPESLSQEINFSVCVFEKGKFNVHFAQKSNPNSPNFALGGLDVYSFIQEFRRTSSHEHSIPVLWNKLVDDLRKIGYFDIQNHNDFQTTVLLLFQRMHSFQQHTPNLRELFYSFVQRILEKNAWFLIVDQSIQCIRPPSRKLIGLFSDPTNLPNVHFINGTNVVGLTKKRGVEMGYRSYCYGLFTVSTGNLEIVHDDAYERYDDRDFSQESNDILAWLFDYDYDPDCPHLVRQYPVKTPAILQGFLRIGHLKLVLFKTGNLIKVFSEKDGKWFEFPPELLILSKIFEVGNGFNELTEYFSHSYVRTPEDFVKELVKCGFFPIFDGTPTREQFSDFLFESDFGCVLQKLRCEINGFLERLREECILKYQKEVEKQEVENPTPVKVLFRARLHSIRENNFIVNFNKIFVFLLNKLRNRDDLTSEIQEIVLFLEQLVEFLTVPPSDSN
jgi:hypothetical protein